MSSIDEQFVEFVVKSLVSKPNEVKIERRIDEKGVLLELTVDPEDLGRVIGKRGATAQSLRTLLRALGTKNDARYNLKIVDNGAPRPERREMEPGEHRHEKVEETSDWGAEEKAEPQSAQKEEPTEDDASVAQPSTPAEEESAEDHSSVVSKTRKELAELDDLDV